jgi:CRP/FNR family cyclic AMP-dependent transcriptional regulator
MIVIGLRLSGGVMRKIANSRNIKSKTKSKQKPVFDPQAFLDTAGVARKVIEFEKGEVVYSQGDAAESILYLQAGRIKLSVVNEVGKEAVVAILEPGDFFGEGCLAGQPIRMGTATAITASSVLDIKYNGGLQINRSLLTVVLHE